MDRHILEALLNGDPTGLLAGAAALFGGAWDAFQEKFEEAGGWDGIQDMLQDLRDEWLPDATTYERAREALDELLENAQTFGENVVSDIGDAINDILGSGEIAPQADGGLGETHDIFAPEADGVPNPPVGELPGFGTDGAGAPRDGGGGGYSGQDSGGGSSSGGDTTPLGDSTSPPPSDPFANTPTHEDLGLDPDGGSTIEYHPNEGEVVITHPDGTTEVRPWP